MFARDTLQRPMRDLRISVTDRCNFRCKRQLTSIATVAGNINEGQEGVDFFYDKGGAGWVPYGQTSNPACDRLFLGEVGPKGECR